MFPLSILIRVDPRPSVVPDSGKFLSFRCMQSKSVRLRRTWTHPTVLGDLGVLAVSNPSSDIDR